MNVLVDSCVFVDAFDPMSPNNRVSLELLDALAKRGVTFTMPAHGWFEVQCTLQRLRVENRFAAPSIDDVRRYPLKLIHINEEFISKYSMVNIPYIKAGDHIFLAVAKIDNCSLITSDGNMIKVARACNISAFTPSEALRETQE